MKNSLKETQSKIDKLALELKIKQDLLKALEDKNLPLPERGLVCSLYDSILSLDYKVDTIEEALLLITKLNSKAKLVPLAKYRSSIGPLSYLRNLHKQDEMFHEAGYVFVKHTWTKGYGSYRDQYTRIYSSYLRLPIQGKRRLIRVNIQVMLTPSSQVSLHFDPRSRSSKFYFPTKPFVCSSHRTISYSGGDFEGKQVYKNMSTYFLWDNFNHSTGRSNGSQDLFLEHLKDSHANLQENEQ